MATAALAVWHNSVMSPIAVVAVTLLGATLAFQLLLAFGAPWGAAAWGGRNPGVLPTRLRIASLFAGLVIYPALILLALDASDTADIGWIDRSGGWLLWLLAGLFGLGALGNLASRSPIERIWAPVALTIAICLGILAASV